MPSAKRIISCRETEVVWALIFGVLSGLVVRVGGVAMEVGKVGEVIGVAEEAVVVEGMVTVVRMDEVSTRARIRRRIGVPVWSGACSKDGGRKGGWRW